MDLTTIKNDVIVELRSSRYFNELEIARLAHSTDINHKHRVQDIARLTRENANINDSLQLMETYFPVQPQPATQPQPQIDTPQ
jgi:hypothetical protein